MKKINCLLSLVLSVAFFSCEDTIDVALEEGEQQLVIDAWLTNDVKDQGISLTRTTQYFDATEAESVVDAQVYVAEYEINAGEKVYVDTMTFIHQDTGMYIYPVSDSNSVFGQVGGWYELHVVDGSDHYVAESEMKRPPIVDSTSWYYDDGTADFLTPEGYYVLIFPRDPVGFHDIYWIKTFRNDSVIGASDNFNVVYDASFGHPSAYDGQTFIPPFRFSVNLEKWRVGDTARIEYHALNITAYEYLINITEQISNSQFALFASPVSNLKTNISNMDTSSTIEAVGFFNVGSVLKTEIVIGKK